MKKIHVIGLGAGNLEQMSVGVYRMLQNTARCYVRTKEHPLFAELDFPIEIISFDEMYEQSSEFNDVYRAIVEELGNLVEQEGEILYAVPGHPLVAEQTVQYLLEAKACGKYDVEIHGGGSFIDEMFRALKFDPVEGFCLLDGTDLHLHQLQSNHHLFICQVYDQFVASEVKLMLLTIYPDDYEVYYVSGAGTKSEKVSAMPLSEIDHRAGVDNLGTLYVPKAHQREDQLSMFVQLVDTIAALRGPNGCPWDMKQTHESLRKYLIEESYEVCEAIEEEDSFALEEELGDVLLQVLLHAQIAQENEEFSVFDVIRTLHEKMIRRHPHVFGNEKYETEDQVKVRWSEIKAQEKNTEQSEMFATLNQSAPQLVQAEKIQREAAKVGFDWSEIAPIWDKVMEEMAEFKEAVMNGEQQAMEQELGDLFFALVNVARFYKIDSEIAVHRTNTKFKNRFLFVEKQVKNSKKAWNEFTLEELDEFWDKAKGENR
ncbi:MAG: nucleoside triphosphate pyrophosphohydrolase [Bacilli bacterium]